MKIALSLCVAALVIVPAHAQLFRPEAVRGAVLGGIAGAVIGNNSGDLRHNAWKGAAIGAGAGLILGEAIGNANAARSRIISAPAHFSAPAHPGYVYRERPSMHLDVGYSHGYYGHHEGWPRHRGWDYGDHWGHHSWGHPHSWHHPRGYYRPRVYHVPSYGYDSGCGDNYPYYQMPATTYPARSSALSGLVLGALAGGIIGHNSGEFDHNAWRGAAYGAGAGWLLGTIADARRRTAASQAAPVVIQQSPVVQQEAPAAQPAPQQITIINNYYNLSPMSAANGLFGR